MSTTSTSAGRSGRAAPLPRDQRRADLVAVTIELLVRHGRDVTTRQIAEAAGVAEGTIFRAFDSKDELVEAALRSALAPGPLLEALGAVDPGQDLRAMLSDVVRVIQNRFVDVFALMASVGMIEPPDGREDCDGGRPDPWRSQVNALMLDLIEPHRDQLRVEPAELVHLMRLLTFSGSHPQIADHELLTPDQIVEVLLDGTRVDPGADSPALALTTSRET